MPTTFFGWVTYILQHYGEMFLKGTGITMIIAISGTVFGFAIGFLVAIVKTTPLRKEDNIIKKLLIPFANLILTAYIEVFRGTPMMVQAMVIFYGLQMALGVRIPFLVAGIIIVSVNTGAYMAEIIRGGIISVDPGQREGAMSIGMSHWQTMTSVILPQAVRNIMPAIGNEFVVNIKDSCVLNVITVSELFFAAKSVAGTYLRYFETFFIVGVIYLILTFTTTRLLRLLERKMDGPKNFTIHGSQSDSEAEIKVMGERKHHGE